MKLQCNISYPSSAAAVVFGVNFSGQAAFRLDPEHRDNMSLRAAFYVSGNFISNHNQQTKNNNNLADRNETIY